MTAVAAAVAVTATADVIITSAVDVIKDDAVGASSDIINVLINDIRISDYGATGRADQRPGHVRLASNVQGQRFCRSQVVQRNRQVAGPDTRPTVVSLSNTTCSRFAVVVVHCSITCEQY